MYSILISFTQKVQFIKQFSGSIHVYFSIKIKNVTTEDVGRPQLFHSNSLILANNASTKSVQLKRKWWSGSHISATIKVVMIMIYPYLIWIRCAESTCRYATARDLKEDTWKHGGDAFKLHQTSYLIGKIGL